MVGAPGWRARVLAAGACGVLAGVVTGVATPGPLGPGPAGPGPVAPGLAALAPAEGLATAHVPGGRPRLVLSAVTLVQGQVLRVRVLDGGSIPPALEVGGRRVPMHRRGDAYQAFVGTSPLMPPGVLVVRVRLQRSGQTTLVGTVRVRAGTFGVRRLQVPPQLLDPALVAEERRKIAQATAHPLPTPQWDGPFRLPVDGPVVSNYGVRSVYNEVPAGYHLGVDFRVDEGTPVMAAQRGLVTLAEPLPLGGQTVVVDHGAGVFTTYLHLSAIATAAGRWVRAGDRVGKVGSTGLSTGPHLHWGVRVHGVLVDPLQWTGSPIVAP
ncbi:MAG: M23 family metallopeptidase [Armatimonadota bacterium]|nr:M23 family metallopeptidase [Armatimonadota bacterium]MDR7533371.1 M23 family metallopeptidase [Armatimonadota bacterium]